MRKHVRVPVRPHWRNRIDGADHPGTGRSIRAVNPVDGQQLAVEFVDAGQHQVDQALAAAVQALPELADRAKRARLLVAIAEGLEADDERLVATARAETGLPEARLLGEVARAARQFRLFAEVVTAGDFLEVYLDGISDGMKASEVRRILRPLGPVAVFGASNFPFAFSAAGGDTASALAAGCPVVVKAHPSHPGTSELSVRVIERAANKLGFSAGIVSLIHGAEPSVGRALVEHPEIAAVGFTGSHRVGRAIADAVAARRRPIPVYAEMGSVNPVFIGHAALTAGPDPLASQLAASLSLAMGQFCTKPGLFVVPNGPNGDRFVEALATAVSETELQPLLNESTRAALCAGLDELKQLNTEVLLAGGSSDRPGVWQQPSLLQCRLDTFLEHEALRGELFGPAALVVRAPVERFEEVLGALDGVLVACLYMEEDECAALPRLWSALEEAAGRIVLNDVPTGVAVVAGMHHGGPYPATSTPLFTSVGATAIRRFLRPIAYQGAPASLLPPELRDRPETGLLRVIDGTATLAR